MKTLNDEIKGMFEYDFATEDAKLFDSLAEHFCTQSQKLKNELLQFAAVKAKSPVLIEHAIALGGDLNYIDATGSSLLHYAASSCHANVVQFFLDKGLSVDARNNSDSTPLCSAAYSSSSLKIIKKLIDKGADINTKTKNDESLLIMAARNNSCTKITSFFLDKGLSTEGRDSNGYTAFLNAARWQENSDVLDVLAEAGVDIHACAPNGDTAFHLAAMNRNPDVAEWLIKHSLATGQKNECGVTCFEKAFVQAGSAKTLNVYLKKLRQELLFLACTNHTYGIIENLIQEGYDVNACDSDGVTALMYAAKNNNEIYIADRLLDCGADKKLKDKNQRNVLHYATVNENDKVFDIMCLILGCESSLQFSEEDRFGHTPSYYHEHKTEF